jgi:hypothetical protein
MQTFIINETDNNISISLENNEDIKEVKKFLNYLLPMFYEIKTKTQSFNDETFQNYIETFKNNHRNEIQSLEENNSFLVKQKENEIKQLNEKIIVLENNFHKEREQIKQNIENLYKTETELRLELATSNLQRERDILESEKNKEIELLKQKIEHINALDKYLENNYNQNLDLHNTIKNHFEEKQLSTSQKGKIGEQYIMNELQKLTMFESDALIDNVSGKSESGDIFLKLKELKCCIEVKNHTIDIRQTQIDKFQRDIQDVRYNSGIFISLYTPIVKNANINNFEIKVINKKPCIYLVNFHQNPENLYLAIKTLLFLLQNNGMMQNDTQYFIEKLNKTIENYNKLQENCNLIEKSVKNSKVIIQNELQEIYKLLKIEESKEFKCDLCTKVYKTLKSLEKHKNDKH